MLIFHKTQTTKQPTNQDQLNSIQMKEEFSIDLVWFSLIEFYGISTIEAYLMPIPFYTYKI